MTIDASNFTDIKPEQPKSSNFTADHVVAGLPIPKAKRIKLFSPDEWESFVEEWTSSLKPRYASVKRFSGSGDKGLDIVGFLKGTTFADGWHNYQCKHYDHPLRPSDIWIEIGKATYYSHIGDYLFPQAYFFVAPQGVGTSLAFLLADPEQLKSEFIKNWDKYCRDGLTTSAIPLAGPLLQHVESLSFSIFDSVSITDLIEQHSKTKFHTVRFGGGLPPRQPIDSPPIVVQPTESRYVQQLFEVYSERESAALQSENDLNPHPELARDFLRQRERFYSAEALRNFARATTFLRIPMTRSKKKRCTASLILAIPTMPTG